jgi:hypothetical protein
MQDGPGQKEPNRRAQGMQLPSGYKHSSTFAKWVRPFNSNAPSMEAQAHTSCNRRAGCYVRATAPPLAPLPRLLDCGTNTVT